MGSTHEKTIWTIGHSTHSIRKFIDMLEAFNIQVLVDIRRLPGSRKFPHFGQNPLKESLRENGIDYLYLPALTGRRKTKKDSQNTGWRNLSFRGYADYMETHEFLKGIQELTCIASERHTAFMCAEAVWWRCHRSLVADYLKASGWTVIHITDIKQSSMHPYTSVANIKNGKLTYLPKETAN